MFVKNVFSLLFCLFGLIDSQIRRNPKSRGLNLDNQPDKSNAVSNAVNEEPIDTTGVVLHKDRFTANDPNELTNKDKDKKTEDHEETTEAVPVTTKAVPVTTKAVPVTTKTVRPTIKSNPPPIKTVQKPKKPVQINQIKNEQIKDNPLSAISALLKSDLMARTSKKSSKNKKSSKPVKNKN